jgi:hypothetical protein
LIYFAVKSMPATGMIMINLAMAMAMVGGVFSVAVGGGVISVASMGGFITLFGVATRNGLLLVDNYNHRLATGMPLQEVIVEGSMERFGGHFANGVILGLRDGATGIRQWRWQGNPATLGGGGVGGLIHLHGVNAPGDSCPILPVWSVSGTKASSI